MQSSLVRSTLRFARFSSIPYAPTAESRRCTICVCAKANENSYIPPILDNAHHCTPKSVAVELLDEEDEYESLPATASVLVQGAAGSIAGVVEHTCFFPVDGESHTAYRIPSLPSPSLPGMAMIQPTDHAARTCRMLFRAERTGVGGSGVK